MSGDSESRKAVDAKELIVLLRGSLKAGKLAAEAIADVSLEEMLIPRYSFRWSIQMNTAARNF